MAKDYSNWRSALSFSKARAMKDVTENMLPVFPGIYVFTRGPEWMNYGNTLYVGIAERQTLRKRAWGYFCGKNNHKGGLFIQYYRKVYGGGKIFVRWAVWDLPSDYEGEMIEDLQPWYNTRHEPKYHR